MAEEEGDGVLLPDREEPEPEEGEEEEDFEMTIVGSDETMRLSAFLKRLERHTEGLPWEKLLKEATVHNWFQLSEGEDARKLLKQVAGIEMLARLYYASGRLGNPELQRLIGLHVCAVVALMPTRYAKSVLKRMEENLKEGADGDEKRKRRVEALI